MNGGKEPLNVAWTQVCLVLSCLFRRLPRSTWLAGWLDQSVSSRCIPLGPPYMFHLKLG